MQKWYALLHVYVFLFALKNSDISRTRVEHKFGQCVYNGEIVPWSCSNKEHVIESCFRTLHILEYMLLIGFLEFQKAGTISVLWCNLTFYLDLRDTKPFYGDCSKAELHASNRRSIMSVHLCCRSGMRMIDTKWKKVEFYIACWKSVDD